jgi:hypothetical protein
VIDLGMKDDNPGAEALVDLTKPGDHGSPPVMLSGTRPVRLPQLPEGHRLFGTLDQGFGERLFLIETLDDAVRLWDLQDLAMASPVWYSAPALFTGDN